MIQPLEIKYIPGNLRKTPVFLYSVDLFSYHTFMRTYKRLAIFKFHNFFCASSFQLDVITSNKV